MKNLKKVLSIMVVSILVFVGYGCQKAEKTKVNEEKPSTKVEKYFADIKLTTGFSDIIGEVISENEEGVSKEIATKLLEKLGETTFTINSESEDGDFATVNVTVNGIEFDVLMNSYLEDVIEYAFSSAIEEEEMTEEEMTIYFENLLLEKFDDITYGERTGDILLEKVNGEWQIIEDDSLTILLMNTDFSDFEY